MSLVELVVAGPGMTDPEGAILRVNPPGIFIPAGAWTAWVDGDEVGDAPDMTGALGVWKARTEYQARLERARRSGMAPVDLYAAHLNRPVASLLPEERADAVRDFMPWLLRTNNRIEAHGIDSWRGTEDRKRTSVIMADLDLQEVMEATESTIGHGMGGLGQEYQVERRRHRVDVAAVLSGPSLVRHRDPEAMERTNRNAPPLVGKAATFERIPEAERRVAAEPAERRTRRRPVSERGG